MTRLRYNGLSNSLGASLTSGGTTITFASKLTYAGGDVPTISGSDYIPLSILDADGNCAEVVHLTAYTSAATTGTIARGKEDTSGVAHDSGAVVVNGPTRDDLRFVGAKAQIPDGGTATSVSNNTSTALVFTESVFDTDSMTDIGGSNPSRITVPTAGVYIAVAYIKYSTSSTDSKVRARLYKNGSLLEQTVTDSVVNGENLFNGAFMALLAAGDYLELHAYQGTGGTLDCIGSLSVVRLSAV